MTSPGYEPGKTSPKLAHDFLLFDPVRSNPNVLIGHAPPQGEGVQLTPNVQSCKHDYTAKASQSVPPPLDLRPDGTTKYKLAVMCKRCRVHADIQIDYSHSRTPCPTNDHQLHHFQQLPARNVVDANPIGWGWQCSIEECKATLSIGFRSPRVTTADLNLLTSTDLLKKRYEALLEVDADRDGIKQATPVDVLWRLKRYISDGLQASHKKFPGHNKRFQEAFGLKGRDGREFLERLGFKYADEDEDWHLPQPDQIQDRLEANGTTLREYLEDVEKELFALMRKLSAELNLEDSGKDHSLASANTDVERTMGATPYQRQSRTNTSNSELPYYNSLGILPDFSDTLIEYAYERQTVCHPSLYAYYFECLQVITEQRHSEQLQIKLATLTSEDVFSRRDIFVAFRYIGISVDDASNLTDGQIRDKFQAQQSDLGAAAQQQARDHLYKIGRFRNSTILINASRQSVDTYEDALSWLGNGVDKSTSDDALLAKGESKENEDIAQRALGTIARARKSSMLNNFLLTGEQGTTSMSVDEALRHLNITEKLEDLDPTMLPAFFDGARQDRPNEQTERAIATIQEALRSGSGGGGGSQTVNGDGHGYPPESWPVGLISLGNTCYLNSLLQYYFSIKPLRDIILDYGQYRWNTATQGEKTMRVGHALVSTVEIEGGQKFAEELKHLFERMIKSRSSAVKPDADLVCRAFLRPKDYKLMDVIIQDEKQNNVNGISNEHAIDEKMTDGDALLSPANTLTDAKEFDSSSDTLVNDAPADVAMNNSGMPPTPPESPGMVGGQQPAPETAPPPLPPRRFSTTKEDALEKAKANATAQQDVTEVHDSITSLLRNGMVPTGQDDTNEQKDVLRSMFSIETAQTEVKEGVEGKATSQFDSAIQLNVPYEDTDIYSALDEVFDLQTINEDSALEAYRSLKKIGPLLQISIPRIGYDKSKAAAHKTLACVRLEDELYLDRYCDNSHPSTQQKRRQCWEWRKQLQAMKTEVKALKDSPVDLDGPNAVAETAQYLSSLDEVNNLFRSIDMEPIDADGDMTTLLLDLAKAQVERVQELESLISTLQKQLDSQFRDLKNIKYRLAAVFFHRGQTSFGHYWIYIHDFANDVWRKYNDERVEKFDQLNQIFEAKDGASQGTPTYAVYVAEDRIKDIIAPVCRDPEPAPDAPPMLDGWTTEETEKAKSYSIPGIAVEPPMKEETGQQDWDKETRQVGNVTWEKRDVEQIRAVRFAEGPLSRKATAESDEEMKSRLQQEEFERELSPPKRARDSVADGHDGSPTKRSRSLRRSGSNVTLRNEAGVISGVAELELNEESDGKEGAPLRRC